MGCSNSWCAWIPARSAARSKAARRSRSAGDRAERRPPRRGAWTGLAASVLSTALAVSCARLEPAARRGDWPQWRGPDRTGLSSATDWLTVWPPVFLWRQDVGEGYAAPAIADGRLYITGWTNGVDTVSCFDAGAGTLLWSHAYPCGMIDYNGTRATPTVAGAEVYTWSHEGRLHAFDRKSGKLLWARTVDAGRPTWGLSGSPLVEGDLLILNAGGAGVAIERKAPHELVWRSEGPAGYASPSIGTWQGRRIAVLSSGAGLVGVEPATGEAAWWLPWTDGFPVADPVLVGEKVLFTCGSANYCALLEIRDEQAVPLWTSTELQAECATPVVMGGYLYAFDGCGALRGLDLRDGTTLWEKQLPGVDDGTLSATADGRLILLGHEGGLGVVRVSPSGCELEGREVVKVIPGAETDEWPTPPVLSNGRVYCRSLQGTLVCLRVGRPGG